MDNFKLVREHNENGELSETIYKGNKKHGIATLYNADGSIKEVRLYINDELTSHKQYGGSKS
jgi:antitoxin component YwqK of YwqJK toxin-antitoxin module